MMSDETNIVSSLRAFRKNTKNETECKFEQINNYLPMFRENKTTSSKEFAKPCIKYIIKIIAIHE